MNKEFANNELTNKDIRYYYEHNRFIIEPETYVDMAILSSEQIIIENGYKKTKYSTLHSYSEELPLNELPEPQRAELVKNTRIEVTFELTEEDYNKFSNLKGKELFLIDPANQNLNN